MFPNAAHLCIYILSICVNLWWQNFIIQFKPLNLNGRRFVAFLYIHLILMICCTCVMTYVIFENRVRDYAQRIHDSFYQTQCAYCKIRHHTACECLDMFIYRLNRTCEYRAIMRRHFRKHIHIQGISDIVEDYIMYDFEEKVPWISRMHYAWTQHPQLKKLLYSVVDDRRWVYYFRV
jgi:hypothetical protein